MACAISIKNRITEEKTMSKKLTAPFVVALIIALLAGALVSSDAFAAGGSPRQRVRPFGRGLAQVSAIGESQISVQRLQGESLVVLVDENTRFTNRDKGELTFDALQVGQWVRIFPLRDQAAEPAAGQITARAIVILPDDFDPHNIAGSGGKVVEVDLAAGEFSLTNREGETLTYAVDAETRFAGSLEDLASLQPEMLVRIVAEEQEDGSLLARLVVARRQIDKFAGEITAVGDQSLTLKLRRSGEEMTFSVDENTRYRTKGGELDGLEDVQVGMVGVIMASAQEAGAEGEARLALGVMLVDKEQLPEYDLRVGGKVVAVNATWFTIENKTGERYTFSVSEETTFRSRQGLVRGLEDLEEGMLLLVGADQLADGAYQAKLVVAMKRPALK